MRDKFEKNENIDIVSEKLQLIKRNFPHCFTKDGELDFKRLEKEFSEEIDIVKEGFSLNWLGKSYAKVIANLETETVIVPDNDHNLKVENANSQNVYIKGDNLDVLKHLVNAYTDKIKLIYIDPPYNTGSDDFVYEDNFKFTPDKLAELCNVNIEEAQRILEFTERKSSSHSAWLTFMYPRLFIARELLSDDGFIFISIDGNELSNLKLMCDEVFGEANSLGNIVRATGQTTGQDSGGLGSSFDFVLAYSKKQDVDLGGLPLTDHDLKRFDNEDERGKYAYDQMRKTGSNDRREDRPNMYYPVIDPDGNEVYPIAAAGYESCWRFEKATYKELLENDYILWKKTMRNDEEIWWPYVKYYLEGRTKRPSPLWDDLDGNKKATRDLRNLFDGKKVFSHPKPVEFIKRIIQIAETEKSIILDFFGGSSTTAHAVLEQNAEDLGERKFILAQIQEPTKENSEAFHEGYKYITDIGIERIIRSAKKIKEETKANIDYGFKCFEVKAITEQILNCDLNKMLTFDGTIIIDNNLLNEFGEDTVLTTWMLEDGHQLTSSFEEIDLGGYIAYKIENTIYLLKGEFTINEHLKALIEKIENEEKFVVNKIVLFGYGFPTETIASLRDNMKHLRTGRKSADVQVEVRY
ncbi:site-specific DNA-methyltransferase [Bacillus amyloliquefaciens]|uniref:site-specific DNA-methyltransferase n=1 Tax=Bacillus amyloliquefaciens TaxID=1390 RepID=UPI000779676A|nr:site-specific DNA-methyltransferase [Bacillus amyloliquefaciens]KYC90553.1 Type III restriction-modification system methylation subunit [Bacillus amyloliquefaciens]